MVKIAVTGKGGVGKTTITAGLARMFSKRGYKTVALDIDPSPNLISSLGCREKGKAETVKPLMEMANIIQERTGAPPQGYGLVFKLNPKVDDILEKFGIECEDGVKLIVLGTIRQGGGGCFCPANAFAKRLVDHLSVGVDFLLMDMEAGVEHLGRGTTQVAEAILVIVEPSLKSVETARHIKKLAADLGVEKIFAVINKLKSKEEEKIISASLKKISIPVIYSIPYDENMVKAELEGIPIFDLKEGAKMFKKIDELSRILENEFKFLKE